MTEPRDMFDITGKTIAITGGAGVLCAAMARELARRGAKICVIDYDALRANQVVQAIEAEGGFAIPVQANVLDVNEINEAFNCAVQTLGHIDVLVNGAGGNKKEATCNLETTFFQLSPDAVRWVFDLNCMGTILPSQVFGRHMAERGQGNIVNISSMTAFRPLTNVTAYGAAKAAVSNFTQWLSTYMCQRHSKDIRVNAIAPGFFLTEQNRFLLTDQKTGELTPRGSTILSHTPMGRFGQPDDLLGTLVYLISDASKFLTGVVIPVDGGFNAYSGV
ncbi:MAG: putative oxidoreductase UxuB [Planctomycetes bacterium ADurb.Bin126]|nr:MAG: putative oxidoreductase UxuB [Planctomycetes bacterium ADurb.Bin126]HOD83642.1 SDR family oxidoreductase [Phycisphaerae bacterium]HQL75792.1 SDR family oxidoreductase [Phycisphaerae bacterium]